MDLLDASKCPSQEAAHVKLRPMNSAGHGKEKLSAGECGCTPLLCLACGRCLEKEKAVVSQKSISAYERAATCVVLDELAACGGVCGVLQVQNAYLCRSVEVVHSELHVVARHRLR